MILNPGTMHFNPSNGAAILDMADYPLPGSSPTSLNNNPAPLS